MELPRFFSARFTIIAVLVIAAGSLMFTSSLGQRGRTSSQDKKKPDKSKLPTPPPLRDPERGSLPAGDQDAIRINSDLVTVVATISRKSQNDPLDLKREDFEILEDGVRQEISNFSREAEQPLQMVVLFDTSLSVAQKLDFERRAAAKFFERVMRKQDRAALFSFSTDVTVLQNFTGQVPMLVNALKQLKAQGATSIYDAVFLASEYLKPTQGRRAIVVISDGGDTTSQKSLLESLAAAQQSDVMIFAVFTGNRNFSENLRDLAGERALETLTAETGGVVFRPIATPGTQSQEIDERSIKELDLSFNDLAEQLRTQYTLGFFSTNDKRDGSFRKLAINIKRSGYGARARRGYYAPKG